MRLVTLSAMMAALACSGGASSDPDGAGPGPQADAGTAPDGATPPTVDAAGSITVAGCFADDFVTPPDLGPDYDQFHPTVGSHCAGTNHQAIEGVQRVVFVGDSVTVGSPPTPTGDFYRARLAYRLAERFGLTPPDPLWEQVNWFDGVTLVRESGDFASCAKYGARTDDLMKDNSQLEDCLPEDKRDLRTLVIMTMGGNDIFKLTENAGNGTATEDLWAQTHQFVGDMQDAVRWLMAPGRFSNGVYLVFGDMYEFTDGTGDVTSCPGASLAGFGTPADPGALADMVIWANEQYMALAVETGGDLIFDLEAFCGHGFRAGDPAVPCYRGPGMVRWFDDTCVHPNPDGHAALADMFMAVISE